MDNRLPNEYYKLIARHPILKPQEERRLFQKLHILSKTCERESDRRQQECIAEDIKTCKHILISSNMRLVVSIAKAFINRGVSMHDLIDEGTVGLIEAAERFDYKKGFRFATYATWWIRQAIVKSLGNQGSSLRLPVHAVHTLKKQSMAYSDLAQEYGREPELREISMQLHIPERKLRDLLAVSQRASSLDEVVRDTGYDGQDALIDERSSAEVQEMLDRELVHQTLWNVLHQLSDKEAEVLRLRFGLDNTPQLTLEETCQEMGITRERVRQVQKRALEKMRNAKELQRLRKM